MAAAEAAAAAAPDRVLAQVAALEEEVLHPLPDAPAAASVLLVRVI
jgi:hypothetical protein